MAVALWLGGCDAVGGDEGPDPEPTVAALAEALAGGDLSEVAFGEATAAQAGAAYVEIVTGMGEATPGVEAGEVTRSEGEEGEPDTASATLTWTWPLGEDGATEWSYDATAELTLVDDAWRVAWSPTLVEPSLNDASVLDLTPIAARRGKITGARGLDIVTQRRVVRVGIDRSQAQKKRAVRSARSLARLAGVDAAAYSDRVRAAGDQAFVEAIVFRKDQVPARLVEGSESLPGARLIPDRAPLAPRKGFAAPILGTVGEVTAEMIAEEPDRFEAGDTAGLSGLQARYDEKLQGSPGVVVDAVGSDGQERELFRVEAVEGEPLALTMDVDLQIQAERALAQVGPASALVAIRPSTGDIVAAANGPGTNGVNLATFGQFAPGSTFKSVSSLALLRSGLTPSSPVACAASIVVDGKRFTNYSGYPSGGLGRIPLRTAVANSCNTAFISQRDRLGRRDLTTAAASLGMGVDHDLGFPAYFGSVTPAATETEAAADLIGQGKVLASPMVMATVIASIQRGSLVVPRLVKEVEVGPPDGAPALKRGEAAALRAMLRGVVTGGSGRGLADVPGPGVIAKTGTAEFDDVGTIRTHAWMIAAQADLAVAVFVERGESGSGTAGPVVERFLRAAR